jgi:hypothetical protein
MGFDVVSTPAYSHILPTIVRSKSYPANDLIYITYVCHRILIAGIRNLGHCPCPRCLIPIDRVANMGKPRDMMQRKTLARVDNMTRRNRVASARECIYERNYAVDSAAVQNLLKEDSLVPTAVCIFFS